jgi:hypothetical protein
MDINREVARQRAEKEAAALEAHRLAAAQQAARDRRQALDDRIQIQLRPLTEKFIRWAHLSNISPQLLTTIEKRTFFGRRQVPVQSGWCLDWKEVGEASGWGGPPRITLAVLTTGEVRWLGGSQVPIIVPAEIEQLVADFIVKHGSTVPWPG